MISRRDVFGLLAASGAFGQSGHRLPNVGLKADTGPARTECGVGALLPWADVLWTVTYNSNKQRTGSGLGLYRIDEDLKAERVHIHDGTHANRFVHAASDQAIIGPYVIDLKGNWKFLSQFADVRLTATLPHLTDPKGRVYMLTMAGELYEMDMSSLKASLVTNVVQEFGIKSKPHFKGGWTAQGRVVVANNGFYEFGDQEAGLFEWDGKSWRALSRKPHLDCAGRNDMGRVIYCTGWDESSVLFWALIKGNWRRYRLPKASHAYNHAWQTEWMRIREVETEHFLVDVHGMFFELQPIAFGGEIWGVKPICQHLRTIPDYCSFRGLLALAGNQNSPIGDNYPLAGQPQSGIWFGKTDDLWSFGRPQGWGGPWRKTAVRKDAASDPFLMTGFVNKVVHLLSDKPGAFDIEVDFLGDGTWTRYERVEIGATGYQKHVFPTGFSAHWVRLVPLMDCTASAEFMYT